MKAYKKIIDHYESCFLLHGDTHLGVDWPNASDVDKRYKVMLDVIKPVEGKASTLLDFGCGTANLLEYIIKAGISNLEYAGLDISEKFITHSREKFPQREFYCGDVLEGFQVPKFDYVVMNGVFTEKRELSFDEMWEYFEKMLKVVFQVCSKGVAFNVMSKIVDWEREDLFHVSYDLLGAFLCKSLTRNFIIRNDYGLYEYTVYLYK